MSQILGHIPQSDSERPSVGASTGPATAPRDFSAPAARQPHFQSDLHGGVKTHRWLALGFSLAGLLLAAAYLVLFWPAKTLTDPQTLDVLRNAGLILIGLVALGFLAALVTYKKKPPAAPFVPAERLIGFASNARHSAHVLIPAPEVPEDSPVSPPESAVNALAPASHSAVNAAENDDIVGIQDAARLIAQVNWALLPEPPRRRTVAPTAQPESIHDPLQWLESTPRPASSDAATAQPAPHSPQNLPWWLAESPARSDSSLTQPRVPRVGSWLESTPSRSSIKPSAPPKPVSAPPQPASASQQPVSTPPPAAPQPPSAPPQPALQTTASDEDAYSSRLSILRGLTFSMGLRELDRARHGGHRSEEDEAHGDPLASPLDRTRQNSTASPQPDEHIVPARSRFPHPDPFAAGPDSAAHDHPSQISPSRSGSAHHDPAHSNGTGDHGRYSEDVQILPSKRGQYYRRRFS